MPSSRRNRASTCSASSEANGLPDQEKVNAGIIEISKKTGIPLIATNDCHYLERRDARAHEILMCVGQKTTVNDPKRMHHPTDSLWPYPDSILAPMPARQQRKLH